MLCIYATCCIKISRNSIQKCLNSGKNKGKEAKMRAFLAITALFLIAGYFTGILPGGIQ